MSHSKFSRVDHNLQASYLLQLFSLAAQAQRQRNRRVVIALQILINQVARRGLGWN
jgi:hypothetical protein